MGRSAIARKYAKIFGTGVKAGLEYRVNFLFSIAAAIAPVIIQTALWIALYGSDPSAALFGFTFSQMIAYTIIAQLVSRLVRTGFEYELNADIKTGTLDRYLVKPVGYFGFRLCVFLGDKVVHTVVTGILLSAAVLALVAILGFSVTFSAVVLFAASMVMAFLLNFLLFWCVGLVGFWLTEIGFLFEAIRIVIIAASGGIFPLAVFGPTLERVLSALPFRFTIQFPVELLCGRVPIPDIPRFFALAAFWVVCLAALSRILWIRGIRRFAAVGS